MGHALLLLVGGLLAAAPFPSHGETCSARVHQPQHRRGARRASGTGWRCPVPPVSVAPARCRVLGAGTPCTSIAPPPPLPRASTTLTHAPAAGIVSSAMYQCDPSICQAPACQCARNTPPGDLQPAQVPQFVLVRQPRALALGSRRRWCWSGPTTTTQPACPPPLSGPCQPPVPHHTTDATPHPSARHLPLSPDPACRSPTTVR